MIKVKEADLSDEVETSTLGEDFPVQFVIGDKK